MKTYTDVDTDTLWLEVSSENGDLNLRIIEAGWSTAIVDLSPEDALGLGQMLVNAYGPPASQEGRDVRIYARCELSADDYLEVEKDAGELTVSVTEEGVENSVTLTLERAKNLAKAILELVNTANTVKVV